MTTYSVLLAQQPLEYIRSLDEKSERIVRDNLEYLANEPYPGRGRGDKKNEIVDGEEVFRLHIGRTHTAFYIILEEEKEVRVLELLDIDEAHKRYGF